MLLTKECQGEVKGLHTITALVQGTICLLSGTICLLSKGQPLLAEIWPQLTLKLLLSGCSGNYKSLVVETIATPIIFVN